MNRNLLRIDGFNGKRGDKGDRQEWKKDKTAE
jgi:hypothetical protein